MKASPIFGRYTPGDSLLHRTPAWAKIAGIAAVSAGVLIADRLWISVAVLVVTVLVGRRSGLPWSTVLAGLKILSIVLAVVVAYQSFVIGLLPALTIAANIAACVLAASLIMSTTTAARLMDAVAALARPFGRIGVSPDRFALTVGIMFKSIPYLLGSVTAVRDSARARGLERNPRALVLPVAIGAVAYARQTGDAIAARGLADDE